MSGVKRFGVNTAGRDFAVGDIHGHFTRLQAALDAAGFDPEIDRLFSVGDLVDRGPESGQAVAWLDKPWFHAVRGNHEQMAIDAHRLGATDLHFCSGGAWFYSLSWDERDEVVTALAEMPLVIEVETPNGKVGLIHADCPRATWPDLISTLEAGGPEAEHVAAMCQWSRKRIHEEDSRGVAGIRAVIVGHTPLRRPAVLGNVYHIDTAGWMDGVFTLIDLSALECIPAIDTKLSYDWEEA